MPNENAPRTELQRVEDRIEEFGGKVTRLENYIKIAMAVALVFGVGGAWGYQMVSSIRGEVDAVRAKLETVKEEAAKVSSEAEGLKGMVKDLKATEIPRLQNELHQVQLDTVTANMQSKVIAAETMAKLYESSRAAGGELEKTGQAAQASISTKAQAAISDVEREKQGTVSAMDQTKTRLVKEAQDGILDTLRGAVAAPSWKDCTREKVGRKKTKGSKDETWCPDGKFIVQMNFDAKGITQEIVVRDVLCCALALGDAPPTGDMTARSVIRARQ